MAHEYRDQQYEVIIHLFIIFANRANEREDVESNIYTLSLTIGLGLRPSKTVGD
jgi:hypothetical protein